MASRNDKVAGKGVPAKKAAPAKKPAPAKKAAPAKKPAPAKKSAPAKKAAPAKRPAARTAGTVDPHGIEGVLSINAEGLPCIKVGDEEYLLQDLANEDDARLTLSFDLKQRDGAVGTLTTKVLDALEAFLKLRISGNIDGSATCCHT